MSGVKAKIFLRKSQLQCHFIVSVLRWKSFAITALNTENTDLRVKGEPVIKSDNLATTNFPYYVENGLRKVYPYYHLHASFCKGRWNNQNLIDMYCKEFAVYPREEYIKRVLEGVIRVNGKCVGLDYRLKNSDYITAKVHRHELAVLATPIHVIYEDGDILVVNKPPSIPVHPCGLYRFNTMHQILPIDYNYKHLHEIHRLDRLTSGVLMYAKNSEKSSELHKLVRQRNIRKEYLCRVEGNFPDKVVVCNKPIKQLYHKVGVSVVDPDGKMCITEFQKLSYNEGSSVVLCRPLTGRIHQIRVHLQYLGYPIINDPLYNSYVFGPLKGKHGVIGKSIDQLLADLVVEHCAQWWLESMPEKPISAQEVDNKLMDAVARIYCNDTDEIFSSDKYKKDVSRKHYDDSCCYCARSFRDPKQTHLLMLLHAFKYESDDWSFRTEIPAWASDNWCANKV